jgi:hypothetical protein
MEQSLIETFLCQSLQASGDDEAIKAKEVLNLAWAYAIRPAQHV